MQAGKGSLSGVFITLPIYYRVTEKLAMLQQALTCGKVPPNFQENASSRFGDFQVTILHKGDEVSSIRKKIF